MTNGSELDPDRQPISQSFGQQVKRNLKRNLSITLGVLAFTALIYLLFVWMT